jgi:hypothetical protein
MERSFWRRRDQISAQRAAARLSGGAPWVERVDHGVVSLYRGTVKLSMPNQLRELLTDEKPLIL